MDDKDDEVFFNIKQYIFSDVTSSYISFDEPLGKIYRFKTYKKKSDVLRLLKK